MHLQRWAGTVVAWAPAKINLFLEILGKRADGYHELATLMVAVRLFDTLTFKEDASELQLRCHHPGLSTGPDNLIVKAARLLQQLTGCNRGARIRLVKRIPMEAGLAGGSTDAAATLAGLNLLWQLGLTTQDLEGLAGRLGSDVPFFLHTPAAWCTGRGEIVQPAPLGKPLDLVLVCPKAGLATAAVYKQVWVPDKPVDGSALRAALARGDVETLGRLLHNRLQAPAESLCPDVARWRQRLESLQPAGQLMSGSGSSLFALCRDRGEAQRLAQALTHGSEEDANVFVVRSCTAQSPPLPLGSAAPPG